MQNLRLGLGLELAQLLAQPRNRAAELAQVELDRVQLLAQPRLEDVDLAGAVQQRIEQSRRRRAQFRHARRCVAPPAAARPARRAARGGGASTGGGADDELGSSARRSSPPPERAAHRRRRPLRRSGPREPRLQCAGSAGGTLVGGLSSIDSSCARSTFVRSTVGSCATSAPTGAARSWRASTIGAADGGATTAAVPRLPAVPRPPAPRPAAQGSAPVPQRQALRSLRAPRRARSPAPVARPESMASRKCCSSSSPRCTRSSAAGVAWPRPSAMRCNNVSRAWLKSPIGSRPAMRAPPFSVCRNRCSMATAD